MGESTIARAWTADEHVVIDGQLTGRLPFFTSRQAVETYQKIKVALAAQGFFVLQAAPPRPNPLDSAYASMRRALLAEQKNKRLEREVAELKERVEFQSANLQGLFSAYLDQMLRLEACEEALIEAQTELEMRKAAA